MNNKCNRIDQLLLTIICITSRNAINFNDDWITESDCNEQFVFWAKTYCSIIHIQALSVLRYSLHSEYDMIVYMTLIWSSVTFNNSKDYQKKKIFFFFCAIKHSIFKFPRKFCNTIKIDDQPNVFSNSFPQMNC